MSDVSMASTGLKKRVSKNTAIAIMTVGGVLFALSIVIPTEQGTKAQFVKICVGAIGLCVLCIGAYLRPLKPQADKK